MLPEYAQYCFGEGNMHDTVMLLGMLGWDKYDGKVEFVTDLFASSGTGQVNAIFPLAVLRVNLTDKGRGYGAFLRRMY